MTVLWWGFITDTLGNVQVWVTRDFIYIVRIFSARVRVCVCDCSHTARKTNINLLKPTCNFT